METHCPDCMLEGNQGVFFRINYKEESISEWDFQKLKDFNHLFVSEYHREQSSVFQFHWSFLGLDGLTTGCTHSVHFLIDCRIKIHCLICFTSQNTK